MEIKEIEKEEKLDEKQINNMFLAIIQGKDITEKIITKKGEFEVKYPKAKDLEEIGRLAAYRLNGIPAKCFDNPTYNLIQKIATLDVIVITGPDWYENAKKENRFFSWHDIPSQSLIEEVYAGALQFRNKVQVEIESDPARTDREMAADKSSDVTVEHGLFEGISAES